MTRFDIRIRRNQFTQSRIERHKNYQSLLDKHYEQSRRKTRGIMVLVFLLILIIAIVAAFLSQGNEKKKPEKQESVSELKMNQSIKNSNLTVFRL